MRRMAAAAVAALAACWAFALCGCTEAYDPDSSMKEPAVSAEALVEPGTLHVGVDASTYPLAGQANGRMSGIEVDVAAAMAQEMGLKVDFTDVGSDGVAALDGGEVDIVMGVESDDADAKCWKSGAFAPSGIALFSMDAEASLPKKGSDAVVAAQTSSLSAWLVTRQYGSEALQAEDELKAAFQALADGSVPYAAADAVVGAYVVNLLGIDAHLVGMLEAPDGYCVGVAQGNDELQQAVDQALSQIQGNGVLGVLMLKWTGGTVDVADAALTESAKAEVKKASADVDEGSSVAKKAVADNSGDAAPKVGANAVTVG